MPNKRGGRGVDCVPCVIICLKLSLNVMSAAKTNYDRILSVFFGPSPAISLGMQIVSDKLTVRVVGIVEGLGPGPRPGKHQGKEGRGGVLPDVSGPQKGPAERGKRQKVSKIFSTLFDIFRAGQKNVKNRKKKCQT